MRIPCLVRQSPAAVVSALIGLVSASSAYSQSVRGTVVDAGGVPVAGVVVQLLDSASVVRARALSDEKGQFFVATQSAGSYRVQTLRIGFRAVVSEPVLLATGVESARNFQLTGLPSRLDTVRVGVRSACGRASESAVATATVWEQVRAAIVATDLSARSRRLVTTSVNYQRRLDEVGWRIREQSADVRTDQIAQPWVAPTPESLHRLGYITVGTDSTSFRAPGMDMLASTQFIDDHCFRITSGRSREEIGMAFEPTAERRAVGEIRGTLFLDRKTSELRAMVFNYVHRDVPDLADGARGSMEFTQLRNGTWTISKWEIRMPIREMRLARGGGRVPYVSGAETRVVTTAVRVEGGELAVARIGMDTLWSRPPLVLRGEVRDSTSGRALVGVSVALQGTAQHVTSDTRGQFRMEGVLPGEYTLEVRTPSLDSLGTANQTSISITDAAEPVRVRVPDSRILVAATCGARRAASPGIPGILLGNVVDVNGAFAPRSTKVTAEWTDAASGAPRTADLAVDEAGGFRFCGLPTRTPITLRAVSDTLRAEPQIIVLAPEKPIENLRLPLEKSASAVAMFTGVVLADSGAAVVEGAEVILPDAAISVHSGARGAFRLRNVPLGTHKVVVRKFGYGPLQTTLTFGANETVDRRIVLSRVQVLNEVVITAADRRLQDFEENRKTGLGIFMTRSFLETQEGRPLSAVFGNSPGVWMVHAGRAALIASSRKCNPVIKVMPESQSVLQGCSPCYAEVWVDGHRVTFGGEQFDINSIDIRTIEAVEYYRSGAETPTKYMVRGAGACGTLVIHTRIDKR